MAKILSNNQLLLRECVKQEFNESDFNDESEFFEFFAVSQTLKKYNLTDDEIENGITGGGNDGGCDGIYVLLNGDLVNADQVSNLKAPKGSTLNLSIIQAKNETSFSEDAIMKFKTVSENLLCLANDLDKFAQRYNERVIEGFRVFRDTLTKLIRTQLKLNINFFYVALANELHPNVQQQAEELKQIIIREYPSATIEIKFINADTLMELYNTEIDSSANLTLEEHPICLGKKNDYVALVNLSTYYKFITNENNELNKSFFEANVRDYQGKNSVNTSIATTLSNTGVTILASEIKPITTKELILENPKIVNGLQTSTEIYNYYSKNITLLEKETRNILVRVVVPDSEESRDRIIFATNNQTSIPKSSLRVTDPIHLQIEMYFKNRGLYYDRRKNYYKNQKKKSKDIIGVSFLAQCLISTILRKPDFARARPSTLLTDEETYKYLYEDNQDLEVYYRIALLGKRIQINLKNTTDMTPAERSDVLFYLIYAVVAKKLNSKDITFDKIKNLSIEEITDQEINTCKNKIYVKYKEQGGNGRVAKSSEFITSIDEVMEIM